MYQSQIIAVSKQSTFYHYNFNHIPFVQDLKRTALYGVGTERYSIQNTVGVGRESTLDLKYKQANYISKVYLGLRLPEVSIPTTVSNFENARFAWCKNIGNLLIEKVALKISGQTIVQCTSGLWIQIQSEIFNPFEKFNLLNELTGNRDSLTILSKPNKYGILKSSETVIIELPLSFNGSRQDALPIFMLEGLQCTADFKLIQSLERVSIFNNIMYDYVKKLDITDGQFYMNNIVIDKSLVCYFKKESKYYYVFRDYDIKSVLSVQQEHTIKIQNPGSNLTEAIVGMVRTGDYINNNSFITYKFSEFECDEQITQRYANLLAQSMLYFVKRSDGPATSVDPTVIPSGWLGAGNINLSNIYLLDSELGYVDRTSLYNLGLVEDEYLRIKVPQVVATEFDIYVNLKTLAPKSVQFNSDSDFSFNCKIDEISFDCIIDTDGNIQRPSFIASKHRINIKDCSLAIEKCDDFRASSDKVFDLHVNDPTNTGILINGEGHWIERSRQTLLGWDKTITEHNIHTDLEKLVTFVQNCPQRKGLFLIPHTSALNNSVIPESVLDYSQFDNTELTLAFKDITSQMYLDSPFDIIKSYMAPKSEITYVQIVVKAPMLFTESNLTYETSTENIEEFILDTLMTGNRFAAYRIEEDGSSMNHSGSGYSKKPIIQQQGKGCNPCERKMLPELSYKDAGVIPKCTQPVPSQYRKKIMESYPQNTLGNLVNSSPCNMRCPPSQNSYNKMVYDANCSNGACSRPFANELLRRN